MRLFLVVLVPVKLILTRQFLNSFWMRHQHFYSITWLLRDKEKPFTDSNCTVLDFFLSTPQCSLTQIHIWCTCVEESEVKKNSESLTHQSCLSLKQQPACPTTALRRRALLTNHIQAGAFLESEGTSKLEGNTPIVLFFVLLCLFGLCCSAGLSWRPALYWSHSWVTRQRNILYF